MNFEGRTDGRDRPNKVRIHQSAHCTYKCMIEILISTLQLARKCINTLMHCIYKSHVHIFLVALYEKKTLLVYVILTRFITYYPFLILRLVRYFSCVSFEVKFVSANCEYFD